MSLTSKRASTEILPPNFDEVARFAAVQRHVRGPGARGDFEYSIHDVLAVAWTLARSDRDETAALKTLTPRRQAHNLYRVYRDYLNYLKESINGQM